MPTSKPMFTPGPWQAHNLAIGAYANGPYFYPLGSKPDVAAANANLCAAAPDLYAALEAAHEHLDHCNYGDKVERESAKAAKLEEKIEKALKKARGER